MGFVFDPDRIHEIGKLAVGLPHEEMCRVVIDELDRSYPGHIATEPDWMFNLAGGATGIMAVLHGSLTEYVIIFGTPVGTEAFSGRYRLDIYDAILAGEMWTYTEEDFRRKQVHKPGELALLRKGQVKGFRFRDETWALEYGRGLVPTSLPIALGDAIFSAMDGTTVWKTLRTYGRLVAGQLMRGKI